MHGDSDLSPAQEHPNRNQLKAFQWGQLSAADLAAVESHIAGCDACCQILRQIPDDPMLKRFRGINPLTQTAAKPTAPTPTALTPTAATANNNDALPKELLDHPRYKIGKFLGAGGMGTVYQAEHRLMNRQVALKIIHRELLTNPRAMALFRQEVKAAARLTHPNIVAAYDAEQAGDSHFLVMEYVSGVSLARFIKKNGPLDVAQACYFIRQAAKGLQHAFESGIVHRDIKPHNLMLTKKGQIKILDFGLARLASEFRGDLQANAKDRSAAEGGIMGTPEYIAPEQVSDSSKADIRADIYSLGCTLFHLLVGHAPFSKGSSQEKLFFQKYRQPPSILELRKDLPEELVTIMSRMMAKDPAERYQTPADVVKDLIRFAKPGTTFVTGVKTDNKTPLPPPLAKPRSEPTTAKELARRPSRGFLAMCPFCSKQMRVSKRSEGVSVACTHCNSYFTVVASDDDRKRR